MEYVDAILYHKIQDSDFTNMYGVKKPKTGGGQTYIQAAGYSQTELDLMFCDATEIYDTAEFWDAQKSLPRKRYSIQAYEVGSDCHDMIELAPRTGRKDYRISRQNLRYRHPAWESSHGFPEPPKNGANCDIPYKYKKNYPGLIDTLYILIIKTINDFNNKYKYYATYINSVGLPQIWPNGVGLENIFIKSKPQGIIFYKDQLIRFVNNKISPFEVGSAIDKDINYITLPENLSESHHDALEFTNENINFTIDYSNITITKVPAPVIKRKISTRPTIALRDVNYETRNRNLKEIGDVGELIAIEVEKRRLISEGQQELADKVEHISKTIGDGLGYDIKSFQKTNTLYIEKYIEVKTTTGGKNKPFDISANEVAVSLDKGQQYSIYRFFGLSKNAANIQYYEAVGPIEDNFFLEPTVYRAYHNNKEKA